MQITLNLITAAATGELGKVSDMHIAPALIEDVLPEYHVAGFKDCSQLILKDGSTFHVLENPDDVRKRISEMQ